MSLAGTWHHFRYVRRPDDPACYLVFTRDARCLFLGRVYRLDGDHWRAREEGPVMGSRESAARHLADTRRETLAKLMASLDDTR